MVTTGLEQLLRTPQKWLGNARVGLLANPTAIDRRWRHAVDLLHNHPQVRLQRLFGPEHGLRADVQDMVTVEDESDPSTGLPVRSLYGATFDSLAPKIEDLHDLDVMVVDLQDIGARYYTYAATLALCMKAAARSQVKVIVLDRPNPINGVDVEGGGIRPGLESFCGLYPIPQRHGMTLGELAHLFKNTFAIDCELHIIRCQGWQRDAFFEQTQLPWVSPSPNIPTVDTAIVYPGMCLLEGTNLSEGRGTTRPFELFGAPFLNSVQLASYLEQQSLPGAFFRPCGFKPMFQKYAGDLCHGVQLHVTDRQSFMPFRTGLAVLLASRHIAPQDFQWRTAPYEFRDDVPAIDLLTGDPEVRLAIDEGQDLDAVYTLAIQGADAYHAGRNAALLY